MDSQLGTLIWRGAPIIVDLAAILLYRALLPKLTDRLQDKSLVNAAIVGGVYLFFCLAVFFLRKLQGEAGEAYVKSTETLIFFGITFGIFLTFIMADTSGFVDRLDEVDVNADGPLASIGIWVFAIAWLALVFLYPAVLMIKIEPTIAHGSGQFMGIKLLGLLGINLMVIITMAHWEVYFADVTPYEGLGLGAKILIFIPTLAFFALFYGPPRMVSLATDPHGTEIVSFLVQLSYFVWNALVGTAWT